MGSWGIRDAGEALDTYLRNASMQPHVSTALRMLEFRPHDQLSADLIPSHIHNSRLVIPFCKARIVHLLVNKAMTVQSDILPT